MGISYSFDIMLKAQFDHKSLEKIAKAGAEIGFTYFCDDVSGGLRPLNVEQVTDYISMSDKHDEECLYIHFQDTCLNLKVTSHTTHINLHFFGFYSKT